MDQQMVPAPIAPQPMVLAPITPQHKSLTRDQRLQVHTLRDTGLSYAKIVTQLDITQNQVQYAWIHRLIPQFKSSGVRCVLSTESVQILTDIIYASR